MKSKDLLKRIIIVTVVAVLAIGICLVGGCRPAPEVAPPEVAPPEVAPPEVAEELPTYRWRVQSEFGPVQCEELLRPWLDDLEVALAGRADVTFELYSAGELFPDDQMIPALQKGTIDFIIVCAGCCALPPIDIIDFECFPPFLWNSSQELLTLWSKKGLGEIYAEAYEEVGGIRHFGFNATDPAHLISSRPIWKYEDLEGLKVIGPSVITYPFEDAGAVSVLLPLEEFYLAGQTGVVEALTWCGSKEAYSNSWHEVYPYFLTNPICGACITHNLANAELWDSLPSDIQEIFIMASESLNGRMMAYYYEGEAATRQYFTLTTMPNEDWAKVQEAAWRRWEELAQTSPRCAQLVKIIKDYNAEVEAAEWWR